MNYMEWVLEKAKELWREREQVMKERLSRAVAAGSGGKQKRWAAGQPTFFRVQYTVGELDV